MTSAGLPGPLPSELDPDGLRASLVEQPEDAAVLTWERSCGDARTALARGLREYCAELLGEGKHGERLAFRQTHVQWAEPEAVAEYPSLTITALQQGTYDGQFTPKLEQIKGLDGRWLKITSELSQVFTLIVWTTDPIERAQLTGLMESALCPVDWMYGLRLRLPFYHGAHGSYEPTSVLYVDEAEDARRRWRRALIEVTATVPVIVRRGAMPLMQRRFTVITDEA